MNRALERDVAGLELRPLYLQVRDLLVKRIIAGAWKPGAYLPSEVQLASELGVSIGTIRKATDDLSDQGLLERQHGRGTRVAAHSNASSRFRFLRFVHPGGRPLAPAAALLSRSLGTASAEERARLELGPRDEVLALERLRSEDGVVHIHERIALPAKPFARLEIAVGDEPREELYVLYQAQCGVTIVRTRDRVSIGPASPSAAAHLSIEAGRPVLKVERIAFALDGQRVEFRQSSTASLHYQTDLD